MSRTTQWVITEMNNTETKPTTKPGTTTTPKINPDDPGIKWRGKPGPDPRPRAINQ
jgi:hypothetical protein